VAAERSAPALAGLAEALWWLGETEEAVRCHAEAYALFRAGHADAPAAMTAIALYLLHRSSLGHLAVARGWLERASRIVDAAGLEPLRGWVLLCRAHAAVDPDEAADLARAARECAVAVGDPDLELCALSQRGAALVEQGSVDEGTALLDEAMVAALAGEGNRLNTVVFTGCNLISSCAQTASYDRAQEWFRATRDFTRRYGAPHLYTHCCTYLGALLFAAGDWVESERALESALQRARGAEPALFGEALARLAELRVAQGRLDEAARLLEGFEDHATSALPLATLALARGEREQAGALARRRLAELRTGAAHRTGSYRVGGSVWSEVAVLLETLAGTPTPDVTEVAEPVGELTALADRTGSGVVAARAARARGTLTGEPAALEQALRLFQEVGMPYEAARTRLALARLSGPARAVPEARAALRTFDALGAAPDADAAAALLRDLGERPVRTEPGGGGGLTARESQVLGLIAEGLSNREVAERLFLSRKTVEHHVRNVLAKLGLRNRAEAAAYVARHPEGECASE
jgi:DNA-binding NarL/FixJ family response regulator